MQRRVLLKINMISDKIYSGYAWIFKANLIDDTYSFVEYSLDVHIIEATYELLKYELLKRSGYTFWLFC